MSKAECKIKAVNSQSPKALLKSHRYLFRKSKQHGAVTGGIGKWGKLECVVGCDHKRGHFPGNTSRRTRTGLEANFVAPAQSYTFQTKQGFFPHPVVVSAPSVFSAPRAPGRVRLQTSPTTRADGNVCFLFWALAQTRRQPAATGEMEEGIRARTPPRPSSRREPTSPTSLLGPPPMGSHHIPGSPFGPQRLDPPTLPRHWHQQEVNTVHSVITVLLNVIYVSARSPAPRHNIQTLLLSGLTFQVCPRTARKLGDFQNKQQSTQQLYTVSVLKHFLMKACVSANVTMLSHRSPSRSQVYGCMR